MAATSQYLAQGILNYMFTDPTTPMPKPVTVYIALCSTIPTSTVAGTEVSGSGYARVAVTANVTDFTVTADQVANAVVITFPTATGAWTTAVAFQIYDAQTAGNPLWYGTLATSQTVNSGSTPAFAVGQLTVTLN